MKITKGHEKLTRIKNGDYVLEGDLISTENIEIELDDRLVVMGSIKTEKSIIVQRTLIAGCGIEAGWNIKAGDGIEAGWNIKAGCGIEAGWNIKAGCGIEAGWNIKAGDGIEAGCGIKAGDGIEAKTFIHSEKRIFAGISLHKTSDDCDKTIKCAELRKGEICYGELIITKEEPKSFRVVCTAQKTSETLFTVGKIYTWENNTITNDVDFTYRESVSGSDPDKWDLSNYYTFIKIKEGK